MKPRKAFFSPPRQWLLAHHRSRRSFAAWPVAVRGMVWMVCGGLLFSMLNTIARQLTLHLDVYQSQFLRYLFGLLVILPWVFRDGWRTYMPVNMAGQFWRGGVHTVGLILWFTALPQIPLADMTAIGFTGPIFIMIGAAWFLGEPMRKDRWIAAIVGFAGVLVVVLPKMSGDGGWFNLVMLASSPVFAASFLITKALTRYEKPGVIVLWQALTVSVLSLPMALPHWQMPTPLQWLGFAATGVLGTLAHYCLTRAFALADISATQSLRFLD
ncbi:MAG: Riboflavin transporter, partial [Pseudomonadota bacterium]